MRRTGLHVLRGLDRGVGAVQDADVQARDPQMTSTMQGLGDPNQLIEVQRIAAPFVLDRYRTGEDELGEEDSALPHTFA